MKRMYSIGIAIVCTILFGIYLWEEGTLSAQTNLSVEGPVIFVIDEQGAELAPTANFWLLHGDDTDGIREFDFMEASAGLFHGTVTERNLSTMNIMRQEGIPAQEYVVRVVKAMDIYGNLVNFPEQILAGIKVANYRKPAVSSPIEVREGETKAPTAYGSLSCWTEDTSQCKLDYKSNNQQIFNVSSTGEITGVTEGRGSVQVYLKTNVDSYLIDNIPVTVTNVQEPAVEFHYDALHPELTEGALPSAIKIGTISVVPDNADVSAYTFEIDGDAHLSIQNQEVFIARDTPANTYTYHIVVKKDGNEIFRSDAQTIQVLEPDPIPTPDPTPDPDPAPQVTFQYTPTISSLLEGYQAQKIGAITPSIQGNYYYEVKDTVPCVEVTQDGFIQILANQSVETHSFTIAIYTDDTKTNHLTDVQGSITITPSQTPDPSPEEEPFRFEYQYSEQLPDSILQRIYDPQNNTFQISTNKEGSNVRSLQEDILTISGTTATIHKACEEGVLLEAEYQNQTYQINIKIAKAEQEPVRFTSNSIDIAYGTISYDPVFSGGSGTGDYVLRSSDPSKIAVSTTSPSTLMIQEGATGEVRILLMRKGDENYRDSTSTQMIVRLLENEDPIDPDPSPDQPSDDPTDNPDTPPVDDEHKKTLPSIELDGTITYEEGFSNEAVFRIEDITANSTQDASILNLEVQPKLVLRLHLDHATLTSPATIKIPMNHTIGNLDSLRYFYENEDGILQEIHPILHQNALEFSSKVMGRLVIAQNKEDEKKNPDPKPSGGKEEEIQTPSNGSVDNKEPSSTTQNKDASTVQKQGITTGDTTKGFLLITAFCLSAIFLILWIRRKKHEE